MERTLPARLFLLGGQGANLTDVLTADPAIARQLVGSAVDRTTLATLREASPDIIVSAGHHWMIGPKQRAAARLGAVGLHPALLPAYRGSYPLWWALRDGAREVGLTLYHLDDGVDTGPIIDQRVVPVEKGDTFASLYVRVAGLAPAMLRDLIAYAVQHDALPAGTPQTGEHRTYRTPARPLRATMKIRWALARRR